MQLQTLAEDERLTVKWRCIMNSEHYGWYARFGDACSGVEVACRRLCCRCLVSSVVRLMSCRAGVVASPSTTHTALLRRGVSDAGDCCYGSSIRMSTAAAAGSTLTF